MAEKDYINVLGQNYNSSPEGLRAGAVENTLNPDLVDPITIPLGSQRQRQARTVGALRETSNAAPSVINVEAFREQETGLGRSQYDAGNSVYMDLIYGTEHMRSTNQSNWDAFGNGVAKLLGTATITTADVLVGDLFGLGQGIYEAITSSEDDTEKKSFVNGFINNEFSKLMSSARDTMNERYVTYNSQISQERRDDNKVFNDMLTAQFWSDDVLANVGFTVGIGAGLAAGKGLSVSALSKWGRTAKILRSADNSNSIVERIAAQAVKKGEVETIKDASQALLRGGVYATADMPAGVFKAARNLNRMNTTVNGLWGFAAASSESRMEALDAGKELDLNLLEHLDSPEIQQGFERKAMKDMGIEAPTDPEEYLNFLQSLPAETLQAVQQRKDKLRGEALVAGKRLNLQAQAGIYGMNIPVVFGANLVMYGKGLKMSTAKLPAYKGGALRSALKVPEGSGEIAYMLKALPDGKVGMRKVVGNKKAQALFRTAKQAASEGSQEMGQQFISNLGSGYSGARTNEMLLELTGYKFDTDTQLAGAGTVQSFGEFIGNTFKETMTDSDTWLQGLVGAMTGIAPRVSQSKIVNGIRKRSLSGPWHEWVEGGFVESIREAGVDIEHAKNVAAKINPILDKLNDSDMSDYLGAHLAINEEQKAALEAGNVNHYKHLVAKGVMNDYLLFREAGMQDQFLGNLQASYDAAVSTNRDPNNPSNYKVIKEVVDSMRETLGEQSQKMSDQELFNDYIDSIGEAIDISTRFVDNRNIVSKITGNVDNTILDELAYKQTMLSIYSDEQINVADNIYGNQNSLDSFKSIVTRLAGNDPNLKAALSRQNISFPENGEVDIDSSAQVQRILNTLITHNDKNLENLSREVLKESLERAKPKETPDEEIDNLFNRIEKGVGAEAEEETTDQVPDSRKMLDKLQEDYLSLMVELDNLPSSPDVSKFAYNKNQIERYIKELGAKHIFAIQEKGKNINDDNIQQAVNKENKQKQANDKVRNNNGDVRKTMMDSLNNMIGDENMLPSDAVDSLLAGYAGLLTSLGDPNQPSGVANLSNGEYSNRLQSAIDYLKAYKSVINNVIKYRGELERANTDKILLDSYNTLIELFNERLLDSTYEGGITSDHISHFINDIIPTEVSDVLVGTATTESVMDVVGSSNMFKSLIDSLEVASEEDGGERLELADFVEEHNIPAGISSENTAQQEEPKPKTKEVTAPKAIKKALPISLQESKNLLDGIGYEKISGDDFTSEKAINNIGRINKKLGELETAGDNATIRGQLITLYNALIRNLSELDQYLVDHPRTDAEIINTKRDQRHAREELARLLSMPTAIPINLQNEVQVVTDDLVVSYQAIRGILNSATPLSQKGFSVLLQSKQNLEELLRLVNRYNEIAKTYNIESSLTIESILEEQANISKQLDEINKEISGRERESNKQKKKEERALKEKNSPASKPQIAETLDNTKQSALGLPYNYSNISETDTQIMVSDDMLEGENGDTSLYGGVFRLNDSWKGGDRSNPLNIAMNDIYDNINKNIHELYRQGKVKKGAKLYVGYSRELSQLSTDAKDGKYNNLALFVEVDGQYVPVGPIQGKTNSFGLDSNKPTLDNGLFPTVLNHAKKYANLHEGEENVKDVIFTGTPVGEFGGLRQVGERVSENKKYKIGSDRTGDVVTDFDINSKENVVAIITEDGASNVLQVVSGELDESKLPEGFKERLYSGDTQSGAMYLLKPSLTDSGRYDISFADPDTANNVYNSLDAEDKETFRRIVQEELYKGLISASKEVSGGKKRGTTFPLSKTSFGDLFYLSHVYNTAKQISPNRPTFYVGVKYVNGIFTVIVSSREADGNFRKPTKFNIEESQNVDLDALAAGAITESPDYLDKKFLELSENLATSLINTDIRFNATPTLSNDLFKTFANFGAYYTNQKTVSAPNAVPVYNIKTGMDISTGVRQVEVPESAYKKESIDHAVNKVIDKTALPKDKVEISNTTPVKIVNEIKERSPEITEKVNKWMADGTRKSDINRVKRGFKNSGKSEQEAMERIQETLYYGFANGMNLKKIGEMMDDLSRCK